MKEPSDIHPRQFAGDNGSGICPEAWEAMDRANARRTVRAFVPSFRKGPPECIEPVPI